MKVAWILLFLSFNAHSFTQGKPILDFQESDSWYSGDGKSITIEEGKGYGSKKVDYKELEPLLEKIKSSKYAYLIKEAKKRFGIDSDEELTQLIHVCKFKSKTTKGKFIADVSRIYQSNFQIKDNKEEYFLKTFKESLKPNFFFVRGIKPLSNLFTSMVYDGQNSSICIGYKLNQEQASSTLVHELTHYVENDLINHEPAAHLNLEEGIFYSLNRSGGEKQAFTNQMRYQIERSSKPSEVESIVKYWNNSIDKNGNIIDEDKFDNMILNDLNYKRGFTLDFLGYVRNEVKTLNYLIETLPISVEHYKSRIARKAYLEDFIESSLNTIKKNNKNLVNVETEIQNLKEEYEKTIFPTSKSRIQKYMRSYETQKQKLNDNNLHYENEILTCRKELQELNVRLEKQKLFNMNSDTLNEKLEMLQKRLERAKSHLKKN